MTKILALIAIFTIFTAEKCKKGQTGGGDGLTTCENLPNIQFSDEEVGTNREKTLKLLTELAAAAKTDAELSKQITAQASLNIKSEFGKKINENVKASQKVSTDFWEQNITITQLYCFTDAQSRRKDLTPSEKSSWNKLLMEITSDRNEYLKQRSEKKNQ